MTTDDHSPPREAFARDAAFAPLVFQLVASATALSAEALVDRGRDPRAGRARQVAFYLVHVGLGWPLERTGQLFGRRRSTISHACRQVEDRRETPAFDRQLARLEAAVRDAVTLRLDLR